LIVGTATAVNGLPSTYQVNTTTGEVDFLWKYSSANNNFAKANGLAADDTNGFLWSANGARLNKWTYGNLGNVPTAYSAIVRTNGAGVSATGVDDLTLGPAGKLYGTPSSTSIPRGIFEVSPVNGSGQSLLVQLWQSGPVGDTTYNLKAMGYNATNAMFYGIQQPVTSDVNPVARGIYQIDPAVNNTATFLAPLPVNPATTPTQRTEIDGVTVGGGKVWLMEKDRNSQNIYIYAWDLTSHTYDANIINIPYADSASLQGAITWINNPVPEPTSLAALGLIALTAMRRRR